MGLKSDELFKKFLEEISNQVTQSVYSVWFAQLELLSLINNVMTIKVPLEVHKITLKNTYGDLINSIFTSLTGETYKFNYITDNDVQSFAQPSIIEEETEDTKDVWETNLNPKFTFDNYIVGNTNRLAYVAARSVAEAPGTIHNPLFIYGRSGLGKTHLMQAIGNYIANNSNLKVLYTTCNEFLNEFIGIASVDKGTSSINYANDFKNKYRNVDVLIIDDIQFLVGAERLKMNFSIHLIFFIKPINK